MPVAPLVVCEAPAISLVFAACQPHLLTNSILYWWRICLYKISLSSFLSSLVIALTLTNNALSLDERGVNQTNLLVLLDFQIILVALANLFGICFKCGTSLVSVLVASIIALVTNIALSLSLSGRKRGNSAWSSRGHLCPVQWQCFPPLALVSQHSLYDTL